MQAWNKGQKSCTAELTSLKHFTDQLRYGLCNLHYLDIHHNRVVLGVSVYRLFGYLCRFLALIVNKNRDIA